MSSSEQGFRAVRSAATLGVSRRMQRPTRLLRPRSTPAESSYLGPDATLRSPPHRHPPRAPARSAKRSCVVQRRSARRGSTNDAAGESSPACPRHCGGHHSAGSAGHGKPLARARDNGPPPNTKMGESRTLRLARLPSTGSAQIGQLCGHDRKGDRFVAAHFGSSAQRESLVFPAVPDLQRPHWVGTNERGLHRCNRGSQIGALFGSPAHAHLNGCKHHLPSEKRSLGGVMFSHDTPVSRPLIETSSALSGNTTGEPLPLIFSPSSSAMTYA